MRGKRFLAIRLTLCMAAGFVPATVWAADACIASQANT